MAPSTAKHSGERDKSISVTQPSFFLLHSKAPSNLIENAVDYASAEQVLQVPSAVAGRVPPTHPRSTRREAKKDKDGHVNPRTSRKPKVPAQSEAQTLQREDMFRGQGLDPVARLVARPIRPLPRVMKPDQRPSPSSLHTKASSPNPAVGAVSPAQAATLNDSPAEHLSWRSRHRSTQQNDEAVARQVEVNRRNMAREGQRVKMHEAMQRHVESSHAAIQAEKEETRVQILAERERSIRSALGLAQDQAFDWDGDAGVIDLDECVGRQILGMWEWSRPDGLSKQRRQGVINRVQAAIDSRWPGYGLKVAPFGSSVTGLVSDGSDLDLVLLDPTRPHGVGTPPFQMQPLTQKIRVINGLPDWYNVRVLSSALKGAGDSRWFKEVYPISHARVPIVKLVDVATDIPADVNINERFGLVNSEMIDTYAKILPDTFRPFVFFLKNWLSRRGLNDPSGKAGHRSFSSYTIALMAIQYLQTIELLPNLQESGTLKELGVPRTYIWSRPKGLSRRRKEQQDTLVVQNLEPPIGYDSTFVQGNPELLAEWGRRHVLAYNGGNSHAKLLGKLVIGFLQHYDIFERRKYAISIVNGKPLPFRKDVSVTNGSSDTAQGNEKDRPEEETQILNGDTTDASAMDPTKFPTCSMSNFTQPSDWIGDDIIVQDPFILDRNTAKNINEKTYQCFEGELQRAIEILKLPNQPMKVKNVPLLSEVCMPLSMVSYIAGRGRDAGKSTHVARQATLGGGNDTVVQEHVRLLEEAEEKDQEIKAAKTANACKRAQNRQKQRAERQAAELTANKKVAEDLQAVTNSLEQQSLQA